MNMTTLNTHGKRAALALLAAGCISGAHATTFTDPAGYAIDLTMTSTTLSATATKDNWNRLTLNASSAGVVTFSAGNAYVSHSGLKYYIQLTGLGCTVVPEQMKVANCTLSGQFKMPELPYAGGSNFGYYLWSVNASFDGNGIGTFTFSPTSLTTDRYVGVARPAIGTFQASFRDFVLMAY